MAKRTVRREPQARQADGRMPQSTAADRAPAVDSGAVIENEHRDPDRGEIARRAYELYCERGREPGRDMDDWLRAERELNDR